MVVSFMRVYVVGDWFGFIRFALLLAVVLFWADRCVVSWALLGLFSLLRVTPAVKWALRAFSNRMFLVRNLTTGCKLRYPIEMSKGSWPNAAKHLIAQRFKLMIDPARPSASQLGFKNVER